MPITTTASIRVPKGPRCDTCGKAVPGGVALLLEGGKALGLCCSTGYRRDELIRMVGESPEEMAEDSIILGHDPIASGHGAAGHVLPLIRGIQALNRWRRERGLTEHTGVTEKAVIEAVQAGLMPTEAAVRLGFRVPNPATMPSIPAPPGQPDPFRGGPRHGDARPIGSTRKSRQ